MSFSFCLKVSFEISNNLFVDEALKDYQSVLELDPKNVVAHKAVRELPAKIEERNEKLKAEMMDNLKKLGNMCLKPFGLSTNNFKMEQNESGSYNIQFQQNPWIDQMNFNLWCACMVITVKTFAIKSSQNQVFYAFSPNQI